MPVPRAVRRDRLDKGRRGGRGARRPVAVLAVAVALLAALVGLPVTTATAAIDAVAVEDAYPGDTGDAIVVSAANGLLANDFGVTSAHRIRVVDSSNMWSGATLDVNVVTGAFTWDPHSSLQGENSFLYCLVLVSAPSTCVTGTVEVHLYSGEPFVAPHDYAVAQGATLAAGSPGVLVGARNPKPGDYAHVVGGPYNGALTLDPNGGFSYTSDAGFTGTDFFYYCYTNPTDLPQCSGNAALVRVSVYPQAAAQSFTVGQDATYSGRFYGVTSGAQTFAGIVTTAPGHGTVEPNNDGTFTYAPNPGYYGPDSFTFCLSGDGSTCYPSTSTATATVTVTQADIPTTTTVTAAPTSSTYGSTVTLTAHVSPAPAGGTVEFRDGGTTIPGCGAVAVVSGTAECATSTFAAGTRSVTASYGGNAHHLASTSSPLAVVVAKAPATIFSVSISALASGTAATFQVGVRSGSAPLVGSPVTVTLTDGSTCTATTAGDGVASCSLVPTQPGTQTVTVTVSETANHAGTSVSFGATVGKAAATVVVTAAPPSLPYSDTTVLTAEVTSPLAGATGTVSFTAGGTTIPGCAAVPLSNGRAACSTDGLDVGTQTVAAAYSGDTTHNAGTGTTVVVVSVRSTAVAYTGETTGTVGSPVVLAAKVTDQATGAARAGAGVTFQLQSVGCTATTDATGVAQCTVTPTAAGSTSVDVSVAATGTTGPATTVGTVSIAKITTALTASAAPNPVPWSDALVLSALVSPATATGTVVFTADGVPVAACGAVTVSGGQASCTVASLDVGPRTVGAAYSGDATHLGSSDSVAVQVDARPTTVVWTGATTATVGTPVVLAAKVTDTAVMAVRPGSTVHLALGALACTATSGPDGYATCSVTPATAGTLTATASVDATSGTLGGSTSVTVVVAKATPTVTLAAPATSTYTTGATLTATVSATDGGTITFGLDGEAFTGCENVPLVQVQGVWTAGCTTSGLPVGVDEVDAAFSGTANYEPGHGGTTVTVSPAPTQVGYTGATSATVGTALVVSATLQNVAGTAVALAGEPLTLGLGDLSCTATTDATGTATCTLHPTRVAQTGTLTVTYAGSTGYLASTTTAAVVVEQATTTLALDAPTSATFSGATTLVATVVPGDGAGTVSFTAAGAAIPGCGGLPLVSAGGGWAATCVTTALPVGTVVVVASYSGTDDYTASSATVTVTVAPAPTALAYSGPTTTTVASSAALSARLTDTVTGTALAGATVTFAWGDWSCTATTGTDGTAVCDHTPTAVAQGGTVVVTYAGTDEYVASSAAAQVDVVRAATALTLGEIDGATVGEAFTVSATLALAASTADAAPAPGAALAPVVPAAALAADTTPSGNDEPAFVLAAGLKVVLTVGDEECTATTDADGAASCEVTPATAGDSEVSASFAGTDDLRATTVTGEITVAAAATGTPDDGGDGTSTLPRTGADVRAAGGLGVLLLLLGGLAVAGARRRRRG